jgi:hypothetical protein
MDQKILKWLDEFEIDDIYCLAVCIAYKHSTQPFQFEIQGNEWSVKHDTINGYLYGDFGTDVIAFQYLQEKFQEDRHLIEFMKSLTWTSF